MNMQAQNISHDQHTAMLTIKTWKTSPALSRWFNGAIDLHEYLLKFDPQTAHEVCKSHLEARGDKTTKTKNAVAPLENSTWYSSYKILWFLSCLFTVIH